MKKTSTILAILLVLLAFTSCHKDKEFGSEKPEVGEVVVTPALNQVDFTWKVVYPGKFQTGVEIGDNEDLVDSRIVEGTKNGDLFKASISQLEASTKYYYRIVVWNKMSRQEGEVKSVTTLITISVAAKPVEGGTVSGGGEYVADSTCIVKATANEGYTFVNWTENNVQVSGNTEYAFPVTGNRTLVANFEQTPAGAISGLFTINDNNDQVYFSQGNLQYIGSASTPYWKFADNQWEVLGDNGQGSDSQIVDRDLFGWGTSGYNHGAVCYQPWSTSTIADAYYAYGQYNYNLYDQTGQADWGYNAISNGGNTTNTWRTLTGGSNGEWIYVFNTRNTTSGIRYAKAQVNNVNGVILLPDNWSASTYSLNKTNQNDVSFSNNVISASQWNTLQNAGAVFLPAAGRRYGGSLEGVGSYGNYWSASYYDSSDAYFVYFDRYCIRSSIDNNRSIGSSVRLVCPAE